MLNDGKIEEWVNGTTIVLVPKVKCPSHLEEFRPLCNVGGYYYQSSGKQIKRTSLGNYIGQS